MKLFGNEETPVRLFNRDCGGLNLTDYTKYEKNDTPLGGIRVVLMQPSYGLLIPHIQKGIRTALMNAANNGARWVGDVSVDREGFSVARNLPAETICTMDEAAEIDGIFWIDDDMVIQPTDITKILLEVNEKDLDFVTGIYYQRRSPHWPAVGIWNEDHTKIRMTDDFPPNSLTPIDGCGFGFVYTSRPMFDAITKLPEFSLDKGGWFPDRRSVGGNGEDFSFCDMAKKAGFQLYVHSGVVLGHLSNKQHVIGREDFLRVRDEMFAGSNVVKEVKGAN